MKSTYQRKSLWICVLPHHLILILKSTQKNQHKVELFPIDLKAGSQSYSSNGSWAPQDACGGHQWNAAINKWVI